MVRPHVPVLAVAWLLATLLTGGSAPASLLDSKMPPTSASERYGAAVVVDTNAERLRRDVPGLRPSSCLAWFADRQARRMADRQALHHQGLQAILASCQLQEVGENVAFGYPGAPAVTQAWLRSPPHRANLLDPAHRLVAVAAQQDGAGRWYVSQVVGRERESPAQAGPDE